MVKIVALPKTREKPLCRTAPGVAEIPLASVSRRWRKDSAIGLIEFDPDSATILMGFRVAIFKTLKLTAAFVITGFRWTAILQCTAVFLISHETHFSLNTARRTAAHYGSVFGVQNIVNRLNRR